MKLYKTLHYKGFTATANFHPIMQGFYGRVVNIADVITFQAKREEDLQKAFEASVESYQSTWKA